MIIKDNRIDIKVPVGTTYRRSIRLYWIDDEKVKHYFTPDDVTQVVMKVRQDRYGVVAESVGEYDEGRWWFVFTATETETWEPHKSYYYVVDSTFVDGDVNRELEGKVRVTPMGGVTYRG